MKKRNDEALKAWNEQLSTTHGVLQFSRQAIVALVRGAEENLHVTPGALRSYINANLIEVDAKPAQQNTEIVQQTASNAGEKDEVVTEFETERCAWLRAEIRAALAGTTGVMDESDVEELTAAVGEGISHSYIARLLAKEIETCDPFNQLVADDVHHLTCDVLENWQDEKDPRVAYIDSRVEFYLQEARRESERKYQELATATDASASGALQQENPAPERVDASNEGVKTEVAQQQPSELRSMGGGRFDVSELFDASPLAKVDAAGATTGDDVREFWIRQRKRPRCQAKQRNCQVKTSIPRRQSKYRTSLPRQSSTHRAGKNRQPLHTSSPAVIWIFRTRSITAPTASAARWQRTRGSA